MASQNISDINPLQDSVNMFQARLLKALRVIREYGKGEKTYEEVQSAQKGLKEAAEAIDIHVGKLVQATNILIEETVNGKLLAQRKSVTELGFGPERFGTE